MENPSILYWKWDDSHLTEHSYLEKADDIIDRSCFSHIYITTHWCHQGITTDILHDCAKKACDHIHARGRKMIFEIDVRAEKNVFAKRYPGARTGFLYWSSGAAEQDGGYCHTFRIEAGAGGELFLGDHQSGEELVAVYGYQTGEDGNILPESVVELTAEAMIRREDEKTVSVSVTDRRLAGKKVFAAICSWYDFPDFFSREYQDFLEELLEKYRDVPFDGLAVDELGLPWHPDFDFTPATYMQWDNAPYYAKGLAEAYAARYGRPYAEELLYRFCSADDRRRIAAINRYFELIREQISAMERYFYRRTKEIYGPDAFVGVHNTWFAIEEVQNTPEVWKTGITWWSAKKDYGFTDEIMQMPVRTALAHKEGASLFYNMWYSEATDQLDTFYPELWRNVRYGGRTISLSYECVNERGIVIELRKPGRLEEISRIEEIIRGVDRLQEAPARCDVAVVMGLEACCNRLANLNGNGAWDSLRGVLKEAFTLARDLENSGYNCDLIGSDEIGRGHLFVDEDGYLRYGNQQYRYLILAYPQFAKPVLADFAGRVMVSRTGFCVVGQYDRDFDGNPVTFCPDVPRFAHRPEITDIISLFEGYEVSKNRVQNGCILQNGDIILTAPAPDRAVGNRFVSRFSHHGRIYLIEAEDVAYLKLSPDGMLSECWSPHLLRCEVN